MRLRRNSLHLVDEYFWLDLSHKKLDAAVAATYGRPVDLSGDEILERLLALNLELAEK